MLKHVTVDIQVWQVFAVRACLIGYKPVERYNNFEPTLLLEIRILVAWLNSIELLKIECQDSHIYMKTDCLPTKWDAAFLEGKGKDRVALIKSLIYARVGRSAWRGVP